MGKGKQFWRLNVLSWEANQFLTKMYGLTIIPQIKLEMFCTSTQECHYVVWTPVGTKVFFVERDDSYIELLLNYVYKFWNLHYLIHLYLEKKENSMMVKCHYGSGLGTKH